MSLSVGSRKRRRRANWRHPSRLSTLDRRIKKGGIEAVREGRRVYVRMHGQEYLS